MWDKVSIVYNALIINLIEFFTAHEITHAFDDVGIQYDSTGSYRPLYDNKTVSQFHEASGQ